MKHTIDLDHLKTMTSGDAGLAREVLMIFKEQAELWSKLLSPHQEETNWADSCHSLKGAACSVGAFELGQACEIAEKRGREGGVSLAEAAVLINDVKDRLGETLEYLSFVDYQLSTSDPFNSSKIVYS